MLPIQRMISKYNHYDYNNPKYIVVHYVGAQSSTAKNNAVYFNGGDRQASAHYFVDNNEIWQVVEDRCGSWAVGNTRTEVNNQNSINIEMCCMGANLLVTDQTEQNTIELVQYLMKKYNIPISNVRTHYEVSGCTKICPNWSANGWLRWNTFKKKVVGGSSTPSQSTSTTSIYRVRKSWSDSKSQIFASKTFEGAKAQCKVGYSVFDVKGNCLYTNAPDIINTSSDSKTDEVRRYAENGTFYPNTTIYFRNAPSTSSAYPTQGTYTSGESVIYDTVVIGTRYNWISWISASTGVRRYMPIKDKQTGESWGYAV